MTGTAAREGRHGGVLGVGNYTVAVVGGGQLARMMSQQATALGVRLRTPRGSESGSTAQVVPDSVVGHAKDEVAVRD